MASMKMCLQSKNALENSQVSLHAAVVNEEGAVWCSGL